MGKIKEKLLNNISQEDLERELFYRYEEDYQQWLESDEFVEYVNGEIEKTKPRYS